MYYPRSVNRETEIHVSPSLARGGGEPVPRRLDQASIQLSDCDTLALGPPGMSTRYFLLSPTGGSAHGKLFPGDQILQMNDEPAEDLSCERAVNILRY